MYLLKIMSIASNLSGWDAIKARRKASLEVTEEVRSENISQHSIPSSST
jgi:hypothetical protein